MVQQNTLAVHTNSTDAIRQHMHTVHHLGASNTSTIFYHYYSQLGRVADGWLSNAFLTHAGVPHGARRSALAMRMGVLWSSKRARMMGLRTDSKCPLCHQEDGGSHIAPGCQHKTMEKMYTARHNALSRQVLKCIQKGSLGGHIVSADVGRQELCETDRVKWAACNHVPEWLLTRPPGVTQAAHTAQLQKLKPDVLLACPTNDTATTEGPAQVYIVEIKTCIDTRHTDQLEHARTQHTDLANMLAAHNHTVLTVPILVGVTGTIYTEHTLQALTKLGVTHDQARACCQKLHTMAINQLHSIIGTRRQLEPADTKPKPRPRHPP